MIDESKNCEICSKKGMFLSFSQFIEKVGSGLEVENFQEKFQIYCLKIELDTFIKVYYLKKGNRDRIKFHI